jgi:hypothetical protein
VRRNAGLFGPDWVSAANGSLATVLGEGWSAPEGFGVWGIDEVHQLFVFLDKPPAGDIELELDVTAMLLEQRTRREIEVFVDGRQIANWIFVAKDNRSVRSLRIPVADLPGGDDSLPAILVEFRPKLIASAMESFPETGDQRRLGLALHRVRRIA